MLVSKSMHLINQCFWTYLFYCYFDYLLNSFTCTEKVDILHYISLRACLQPLNMTKLIDSLSLDHFLAKLKTKDGF